MSNEELTELADKLVDLGSVQKIYNFLNNEGIYVQSYSNFSKIFRNNYYYSYRKDLVHKYLSQDSDKYQILNKLRSL